MYGMNVQDAVDTPPELCERTYADCLSNRKGVEMAFLRVMTGKLAGREFKIQKDKTVIGRAADADISISHPSISSHHCCLSRGPSEYTVRDLSSTNGTRVNNEPITESALRHDDVLALGSVDLAFCDEDDRGAAPAAPLAAGPDATDDPSTFAVRRGAKWRWGFLIALISLVTAAALAWFVYGLLQS